MPASKSGGPPTLTRGRDLDGDRQLDLIAIDARLNVFFALAPGFAWSGPTPIPTALAGNRGQILTSVTGAPL